MANPVIQDSHAFNAQVAGFGAFLLYTTLADIVLRFSFYCSLSAGTGQVIVKLHYTDDHGVKALIFDSANLNSPVSKTITFRGANATQVTVEVNIVGTVTYDLYTEVESF